jgi:WD40 repeat protein
MENVVAYISEDLQNLELVDAQTMTNQKLALPTTFQELVWSPSGDRIAAVAEDGSVWQVNYPTLENLEQLTPLLPEVSGLNWSSDGNSLLFISSSDIYIVDTVK